MNTQISTGVLRQLGIDKLKIPADAKKTVSSLAKVNSEIVSVSATNDDARLRLKIINAEKKKLTAKLDAEQKQIKREINARTDLKLMLLGERQAYTKQLQSQGVKINPVPLNSVAEIESAMNRAKERGLLNPTRLASQAKRED